MLLDHPAKNRFVLIVVLLQGLLAALLLQPATVNAKSIPDLYERLNPAVVTVRTKATQIRAQQEQTVGGLGSGTLIKENWVLTAAHVVEGVDQIQVEFESGDKFAAKVIGFSRGADVALLEIDGVARSVRRLPKLGDSSKLRPGEQVFVIGAPFGLEHSLSVGVVSGKMERSLVANGELIEFIQTDAAINRGNSGGPMFNAKGELVGVVSFILSQNGEFSGVGFAAAINPTKSALSQSQGFWGGVDALFLDEQATAALNVPASSALLVQRVHPGSLAERAGLRGGAVPVQINQTKLLLGGDVIVQIMGHTCQGPEDFARMKRDFDLLVPGSAFSLRVLRGGKSVTLEAEVGLNDKPIEF